MCGSNTEKALPTGRRKSPHLTFMAGSTERGLAQWGLAKWVHREVGTTQLSELPAGGELWAVVGEGCVLYTYALRGPSEQGRSNPVDTRGLHHCAVGGRVSD